jgi:hypothetical protein
VALDTATETYTGNPGDTYAAVDNSAGIAVLATDLATAEADQAAAAALLAVIDSGNTALAAVTPGGVAQPAANALLGTPEVGDESYEVEVVQALDSLGLADVSLTSRISTEEVVRAAADTSLTSRISTEETTRAAADTSIVSRFSTADVSLTTRIASEEATRAAADVSLGSRITALSNSVDARFAQVNDDIAVAYQGIAMGFAMNAAPVNVQAGEWGVSGGVGTFEGETAFSLKLQGVSADGVFTWGASAGVSNDTNGFGIGIGMKFPQ